MMFLVGGGPSEGLDNVHDQFVEAAKKRGTRVLVALLGSPDEAGELLAQYGDPISSRWPEAQLEPVWLDDDEDTPTVWPEALAEVAAVVVAGGWTPGYLEALRPQRPTLARLVRQGVPYIGYSAGAMVVAKKAIVGGARFRGRQVVPEVWGEGLDELELREGLGLIGPAVDVHTDVAGMGRAMAAIEKGAVGSVVVIDEGTCLVVDQVSGRTTVEGTQRVHWLARDGKGIVVHHESSSAELERHEDFLAVEREQAEREAAEQKAREEAERARRAQEKAEREAAEQERRESEARRAARRAEEEAADQEAAGHAAAGVPDQEAQDEQGATSQAGPLPVEVPDVEDSPVGPAAEADDQLLQAGADVPDVEETPAQPGPAQSDPAQSDQPPVPGEVPDVEDAPVEADEPAGTAHDVLEEAPPATEDRSQQAPDEQESPAGTGFFTSGRRSERSSAVEAALQAADQAASREGEPLPGEWDDQLPEDTEAVDPAVDTAAGDDHPVDARAAEGTAEATDQRSGEAHEA